MIVVITSGNVHLCEVTTTVDLSHEGVFIWHKNYTGLWLKDTSLFRWVVVRGLTVNHEVYREVATPPADGHRR